MDRGISPLDTRFYSPDTGVVSSMSEEDIAAETPRGVTWKSSSKGSKIGF